MPQTATASNQAVIDMNLSDNATSRALTLASCDLVMNTTCQSFYTVLKFFVTWLSRYVYVQWKWSEFGIIDSAKILPNSSIVRAIYHFFW